MRSEDGFSTVGGANQKEINKSIDNKLTAHASQLADYATAGITPLTIFLSGVYLRKGGISSIFDI